MTFKSFFDSEEFQPASKIMLSGLIFRRGILTIEKILLDNQKLPAEEGRGASATKPSSAGTDFKSPHTITSGLLSHGDLNHQNSNPGLLSCGKTNHD